MGVTAQVAHAQHATVALHHHTLISLPLAQSTPDGANHAVNALPSTRAVVTLTLNFTTLTAQMMLVSGKLTALTGDNATEVKPLVQSMRTSNVRRKFSAGEAAHGNSGQLAVLAAAVERSLRRLVSPSSQLKLRSLSSKSEFIFS